jgi:RNase P/RNase MRP subunit POP5
MASVTMDRVARVQSDILDAVVRTSPHSTLPARDQEQLLAQSCAEACDLLGDWLTSGWFQRARPADDVLLAEEVPGPEQFAAFLGPILGDTLDRIARGGVEVTRAQLEQARDGVAALSRRHRRLKRAGLYEVAERRVQDLTSEVCRAAGQMKKAPAAFRSRARRALKKVAAFLPAVALTVGGAMLGVGPHQMEQSVSGWAHDAARVVVVYHLAELAQPGVRISPPSVGPQLR